MATNHVNTKRQTSILRHGKNAIRDLKCIILHIGNGSNKSTNVCRSYTIGGMQLPVNTETSDLRVFVDSKLM